jgi:hypothetical protein
MQRTIARWLVDHEPEATRRCYEQPPVGTGCACNQCCNLDAAAGRTFVPDFVTLLGALGIDPTKPAELGQWYREPSGLFLTGGWFHFVGSILTGEDAMHWENNSGTFRFEEFNPGLEFGLTARAH